MRFSNTYWFCLLGSWLASAAHAQQGSGAGVGQGLAASAAGNKPPLVLTSGKRKALFWSLAPGEGYALRFVPPAASQQLSSIKVFLQPFGTRVAKGQVRVRVASMAANGAPADDNLLPHPMQLTEAMLQALDQPLVLTWPDAHLVVPAAGFFVVIEGLGDAPDEYVLRAPRLVVAGPGNHQIVRRSQPGAAPRLVSTFSIPEMWSAKPATPQVDFWAYGGDQPQWKAFPTSSRVPLLEVSFE